ncbi:GDYXXLXY domain-containing protein [Psychrobacter sp. P11G5]|uniref:GDYXXLXY domain-containing protein n=1 Tax=Psychrobacter sp. P11G5 TaxID=1699624 RepID=UPI00082F3904|nr:GDYXXLXY domain-containing protein [Psychrobacter sp. P11G5]
MNDTNDNLVVQKPLAKPLPWWQKRPFTISVALLGLLLIIVMMTINVAKYETHLATGDTVLLELAPVDPRGFMQGDYMTLSYTIERKVFNALENHTEEDLYGTASRDGYVIVALDDNRVGEFIRLADAKPSNLTPNEMAIHYRIRHGSLKLATNAFFFQEGHAEAYEAAEYGLFRINDKGEPLLTNMVDAKFKVIEIKNTEVDKVQADETPN